MDILSMTQEELIESFKENSIPAFRAKQVYEWLHKHCVLNYEDMLNLPKNLRERLTADYPVISCTLKKIQTPSDGTMKLLYALSDGDYVECVIMKYKYGYSICVST